MGTVRNSTLNGEGRATCTPAYLSYTFPSQHRIGNQESYLGKLICCYRHFLNAYHYDWTSGPTHAVADLRTTLTGPPFQAAADGGQNFTTSTKPHFPEVH
jgi:hypothetical protein